MKIGLILIVVSVVWYIVHAGIYNYYLQKNNPGLFDELEKPRKKQPNEVQVVVTSGKTPAWVMLMAVPPIPLFISGIVVTIIGLIVGLFK